MLCLCEAAYGETNPFDRNEFMKTKIQAVGNRIVVKAIKEEAKNSLIIIPDVAKDNPIQAKVIALGTGALDKDGKKIPFDVVVGDIVIASKYSGTELKIDGEEFKIVSAEDILAIVE